MKFPRKVLKSIKNGWFSRLMLIVVVIFALFSESFSAHTQNFRDDATITDLTIKPLVLKSLPFKIQPEEIFLKEKLTFTLGPALDQNDQLVIGFPCELWILPPKESVYIVFKGITDANGICKYETDKTLSQQNLVLLNKDQTTNTISSNPGNTPNPNQNPVSGNVQRANNLSPQQVGGNTKIANINAIQGGGFGFGTVYYQNSVIFSNSDNYVVSGGIIDIGIDYLDDGGTLGGEPISGGGSGPNRPSTDFTERFNFLPRTGGDFVAFLLILGIFLVIIIFAFFLTRSRDQKISDKNDKN